MAYSILTHQRHEPNSVAVVIGRCWRYSPGIVFGVANVGINYMLFFDGFLSAAGRSLLSKFLVQEVYHIDESYHGDAATIGTGCFLEHRMQSFRCCL